MKVKPTELNLEKIELFCKEFCRIYWFSKEELTIHNRKKQIVIKRHLFHYHATLILPEIPKVNLAWFVDRDHSSVNNSCDAVTDRMFWDKRFRNKTNDRQNKLKERYQDALNELYRVKSETDKRYRLQKGDCNLVKPEKVTLIPTLFAA